MKNSFITLLLLSLLSLQAAAVYGGRPIEPSMRKSLVNIKLKLGPCSGVLVSPTVVATAAHCKDLSRAPEFAAWINGDVKKASKACDKAKIVDFAYPPYAVRFFPGRGASEGRVHTPDLVLFKLEKPLCSATPALLQKEPLAVGDRFTVTGYGGRGGQSIFIYNNQIDLYVIETPRKSEDRKKMMTTDHEKMTPSEIAYFLKLLELAPLSYAFAKPVQENTTICGGDSGGPAFVNENGKMLLYGLNGAVFPHDELGADKCNSGYIHAITPIAPHYDWIMSMVEEWSS